MVVSGVAVFSWDSAGRDAVAVVVNVEDLVHGRLDEVDHEEAAA